MPVVGGVPVTVPNSFTLPAACPSCVSSTGLLVRFPTAACTRIVPSGLLKLQVPISGGPGEAPTASLVNVAVNIAGRPIAVNTTGLPLTPADAVTTLLSGPMVHDASEAMPAPFVETTIELPLVVPSLMVPPPAATANVTGTPDVGIPVIVSRMITDGGVGTLVPAGACWRVGELFVIPTSTALMGLKQHVPPPTPV